MSASKIIAGVEIGTSKTVVLVGEINQGRALNIIGMGECTTVGMSKGEIQDLRSVSDCVHAAILSAEKNAATQIDGVYLSKSGASLTGMSCSGVTSVSSMDGVVSRRDVHRACTNAKEKSLPPGRIYVHHIRTGYMVDGEPTPNPVGCMGSKLEALYWHVHGDERAISNHIHVINGFSLDVEDMIISSIASGTILTTEAEKRQGALVIDIGSGTTDYALYRNGKVQRTGVIPVGGDHITNDLSLGLRISRKMAENLKLREGKAILDKNDKNDAVLLLGDLTIGDRPIPRNSINKIIHARMEELFMIMKNRLGSFLSPQQLPGGIVITGGTSRLPHIEILAEETLGVSARIATSPAWVAKGELQDPEYACALGLLHYGLYGQQTEEDAYAREAVESKGWFGKIKKIIIAN
jgi:cell division protein FtsA